GEEPQAHDVQAMEMVLYMAQRLTGKLGCRIRGNRLEDWVVLLKRDFLVHPVHAGRGGKHEFLHAEFPRQLQQVLRAEYVDLGVKLRVRNGWSHTRARCEMDDGIEANFVEHATQSFLVPDVRFDQPDFFSKTFDISSFD